MGNYYLILVQLGLLISAKRYLSSYSVLDDLDEKPNYRR